MVLELRRNDKYKMGKLPRLKYGKNVKLLDDGKTLVAEKAA